MKIVVDKKITKLDGEVEDLLQTSQIVTESDKIRTIEDVINEGGTYSLASVSLKGLYIVSDNTIEIFVQSMGSTVAQIFTATSFSFTGTINAVNITLTNNSTTDKAKIKVVMVA